MEACFWFENKAGRGHCLALVVLCIYAEKTHGGWGLGIGGLRNPSAGLIANCGASCGSLNGFLNCIYPFASLLLGRRHERFLFGPNLPYFK